MTDQPVNRWFHEGVEYTDHRLPNGCIVTTEVPRHPRRSLDDLVAELGLSEVDLNNLITPMEET